MGITIIKDPLEISLHYPDAPWCWNNYQHLPEQNHLNVGKYTIHGAYGFPMGITIKRLAFRNMITMITIIITPLHYPIIIPFITIHYNYNQFPTVFPLNFLSNPNKSQLLHHHIIIPEGI